MAELSVGLQLTRQIAAGEAAEARYELIEPEHLFIGLCSLEKILQAVELGQLIAPKEVIMALRPEWKVLVELFTKFHLNPTVLRRELRKRMGPGNYQGNDKTIHRSPQSRQAFERTQQLAQEAPASMVDVTYLLAALLGAYLLVGGEHPIWEEAIESLVNPRQSEMKQMIEPRFTPAHTHPFEALLNQPFTGTFH
jgi:Clp amino terminal domain, pathogenicity island component